MEPFELSLRQVNLEEKDIKDTDTLDSFGNIVSYDSDFKDDSEGLPIFARKILGFEKKDKKRTSAENAQSFLIEQIHETKRKYYSQGQGGPEPYDRLSVNNPNDKPVQEPHLSSGSSPIDPTMLTSPGSDSLRAFTQTTDALALQSSVIGKTAVSPASPEEVARVIAETQKKLQKVSAGYGSSETTSEVEQTKPQESDYFQSLNTVPARPNFVMDENDDSLLISMTQEGSYDISMTNSTMEKEVTKEVLTEITKVVNKEVKTTTTTSTIVIDENNVVVDTNHIINTDVNASSEVKTHESTESAIEGSSGTASTSFNIEGNSGKLAVLSSQPDLDYQSESSTTSYEKTQQSESEMSDSSTTKKNQNKKHRKTATGSSAETSVSPYGDNHGKALIRVPKENITVEKSSSWFYNRGKACAHPNVTPISPEKESISTDEQDMVDGPLVVETKAEVHAEDHDTDSPKIVNREILETNTITSEIQEINSCQSESNIETSKVCTQVTHVVENEVVHEEREVVHESVENPNNIPEISAFNEFCKPDKQVNGSVSPTKKQKKSKKSVSPRSSPSKGLDKVQDELTNHVEHYKDQQSEQQAKPYVEADITESPKNYENKVKEMELENSDYEQGSPGSKDYKKLKKDLEKLMRSKAKLEGQLEVMDMEAKNSLKQRSELQSQVAALKEQMKAHHSSVRAAIAERDAVSYDMLTMKQNKNRLEQVILDAHKLMADKDEDLKTINEDLQLTQKANEELQEKLKDLKREIQSKDTTIQDLKNKITELYVQFETTNQTKILLENEIRSLKSEVNTLATAKEWYQQQLQQAQEAKTGLQKEITSIKGEVITKTTMIERLKAENVRIKQHITDTQQRVIQEKQLLAQHLEAIEADMLEREAAFTQILRERDTLQEVLKSRGESPETALKQMASAAGDQGGHDNLASDLDLRRLGNDIRRKEAHISVLEHEQAELMKRLALSQESIIERDKSIESLERKYVEVEVTLKTIQQDLLIKEEDLTKTKQEKSLIEGELSSVKSEKKSFDAVIQNLKEDMTKVEKSFKHIKQELAQKSEELHQFKLDKDKTNEEIAQVFKKDGSPVHVENQSSIQVQQEVIQQKMNEDLQNLKSQKSQLEQDLKLLKSESSSQIQELLSQKVILENKVSTLETRERNSPERNLEVRNLVQETIKEVERSKEMLIQEFSSTHVEINKETLIREYVKVGNKAVDSIIQENNKLKMVVIQMMNSMKTVIDDKFQGLKSELDEERKEKKSLELQLLEKTTKEHEHLTVKIKELERELHILRDNEARSDQEVTMALTLELEKEKGKLAAVLQTCDQLKTHTAQLEAQMAVKESSTVALSSQAQQEMRGRDKEIIDLQEKVKAMEETEKKEKHILKEVKKQLMSEKGSHVKTRRKFEALWVDHDQMRVDYENKIKETENLTVTLEKTRESETKMRETFEKINADHQQLKVGMEQMKIKVGEREAKDPVVGEHIKSLEWQLQQKEQEIYAGKQQLKMIEDRQLIEVENMRKTIQGNTGELSKLRENLAIIKKEKTLLQSRNTQLKNALQATLQANKHGKGNTIDFAAIEKLLQDTTQLASQSKPLSFLQATLHDLRGEISTLQTQMDQHATAVQSSSQAWRELEQQVKDLREICKSTAADREASKGLLSGSAKAAAHSPIAMATQAVARSTAMQAGTNTFIPPIPVKLPENMDFSLPPMDSVIVNGSESNNAIESATKRSMTSDSKEMTSLHDHEERRINTKGLVPNSVYSPPTPSKSNQK